MFFLLLEMLEEGIEVSLRTVVRGGESLGKLVNVLTGLYGQGKEGDSFYERLVFKPKQELGNMNFINRDSVVCLEYSKNHICVDHVLSTLPVPKGPVYSGKPEIVVIRRSKASNPNVRRLFQKSGFKVLSDFAKKGLVFNTRYGIDVSLSRPYNAQLSEKQSYETGTPVWESVGGHTPLGQDYLLEFKKVVSNQADVEACLESIGDLQRNLETQCNKSRILA